VSVTWFGVRSAPKTPPEIAAKLSTAIAEAVQLPDLAKKLQDFSATPVGSSPEEPHGPQAEVARWHNVILSAGIRLD